MQKLRVLLTRGQRATTKSNVCDCNPTCEAVVVYELEDSVVCWNSKTLKQVKKKNFSVVNC